MYVPVNRVYQVASVLFTAEMEEIFIVTALLTSLGVVLIASMVLMLLEWAWLKPKRLEKWLRQQGFSGNSYRLIVGDIKDLLASRKRAKSEPIQLSDSHHQVVQRTMDFEHHIVTKYGKKSFFWTGPRPNVMVTDPKLIREVLVKYEVFQKPKVNPLVKSVVTGMVSYEGEHWHKVRKIVNPAFHQYKLKDMFPSIYWSCNNVLAKWKSQLGSDSDCVEIDVWPDVKMLTSDVISRTAFGSSYEEGRKIFELIRQQIDNLIESFKFTIIPGYRFLPTALNRRMRRNCKETATLIKGLIEKREKAIKLGEANTDDLLGILIESNHKEMQEQGHKKGSGLSIEEVIEECKLFYLAGQETTGSLIIWAMILLSIHQNWQELAREEVLQTFKNNQPKFDDLNNLKIVTKILYETLRLYAPAVLLNRASCCNTKLGDIEVRPEIVITMPLLMLHHDTEYWGEDAGEFNPDRFSEGVSKAAKTSEVPYFPFGGGPRICIGQNFALVEAKLALAMILQNFSFKLSASYSHTPTRGITTQPQFGAPLLLQQI